MAGSGAGASSTRAWPGAGGHRGGERQPAGWGTCGLGVPRPVCGAAGAGGHPGAASKGRPRAEPARHAGERRRGYQRKRVVHGGRGRERGIRAPQCSCIRQPHRSCTASTAKPCPAHPAPPLNPLPPPPRSCCLPSLWLPRSGRACASGCRPSATAMSARATAYSGELGGRRQGRGVEAHVACGARGAQARHRASCCRVCSMAGGRDMPQQQHALNPSSLPSRRRHRAGASCAAAAARSAGRGRWHTTSPAPCAWEGATPDAPRAAGECGRGRYLPTSGRAAGALACGLACACAVFGEPAAAQLPTSLGVLRSGAGIHPSSARFLCAAGTSARAPCSCTSTRQATRS